MVQDRVPCPALVGTVQVFNPALVEIMPVVGVTFNRPLAVGGASAALRASCTTAGELRKRLVRHLTQRKRPSPVYHAKVFFFKQV
jgi:hypothetical protein